MRYRIEVRQTRYDITSRYIAYDRVKAGKAQRLVDGTALGIATHERRHGQPVIFDWHPYSADDVAPATVRIPELGFEAVVSATPIHEQTGEV